MFKMPKEHDCKCSEGLNYNPKNKTCIKCVKSGNALEEVTKKMLKSGDIAAAFLLALYLTEKQIERKKEKEEKENKGDN